MERLPWYAVWVNRDGRALCLLILVLGVVFARGYGQTQSDADATVKTLRAALDKFDQAKESKTRFTYLDLNHTLNFNDKGKKTADYTELFDVTYIADLQYSRLLEINGKALTGKSLDEEQKRYDDAVRERSALDDNARAKIQHQMMKDAGVVLGDLKDYRNIVAEHASIDGRDCVVIDSTPLTTTRRKHYRYWLDAAKEEVLRVDFNQLADEGDILSGGSGRLEWIYMDGTPLLLRTHIDADTFLGKKRVRLVVDHTYSNFRKFSVTTTIVPVANGEQP